MDDMDLLQEFAARRSEEAFRALVERRIDFVYSVALRQLRDPQAAEEVTQTVFIDLAAKAARIPRETVLSGWLFRAARFAAAKQVRSEVRRQRRERAAAEWETALHETAMESPWEQMEPLLNEALEELTEPDRCALLLRFFEKKALREIGQHLGLHEDAAKKRVARALERLRLIFQRRGVVIPAAALLSALSAHTLSAAPPGLVSTVTSAAIVHGTTTTAASLTITKGILKLMALSKLKAGIAATAALLLVAGTTRYVLEQTRDQVAPPAVPATGASRGPTAVEPGDDAALLKIIRSMNPAALEAAPARVFLRQSEAGANRRGSMALEGRMMGTGLPARELLAMAYSTSAGRVQTAEGVSLPKGVYDFLISVPPGPNEALQQAIREKWNLTARLETREEEVYVLKARPGDYDGRRPTDGTGGPNQVTFTSGQLSMTGATMASVATVLEPMVGHPILDESGLKGQFEFFLTLTDSRGTPSALEPLRNALREQAGLELELQKRKVEILRVERSNTR